MIIEKIKNKIGETLEKYSDAFEIAEVIPVVGDFQKYIYYYDIS